MYREKSMRQAGRNGGIREDAEKDGHSDRAMGPRYPSGPEGNRERSVYKWKPMALTLLCAMVILGTGYGVIVESGKKVLEKERTLEEAEYENTSSHIFYGKIDEDIELFPWNYFPEGQESGILEEVPQFLATTMEGWDMDEELKQKQNWYLYNLIGWESGIPAEDVFEWYGKNQKSIMGSMVMVEDSPVGSLFFYQDSLNFGEKQYQVRVACSYWNIVSFICMESREGQERDRKAWEEGKETLVEALETSEEELAEYFSYMMCLRNLEVVTVYDGRNGEYVNAYLTGLRWLEGILQRKSHAFYYVPEGDKEAVLSWMESMEEDVAYGEKGMGSSLEESVEGSEYSFSRKEGLQASYSYQIVELKDMILLLMQGEQTLGLYYDPIRQKFCGHTFFYEY